MASFNYVIPKFQQGLFVITAYDSLTSVCALQCELIIRQGLVRRAFAEWQRLCQERDWKTQLATRDNEIKRMDREVRQAEPLLSQVFCCHTVIKSLSRCCTITAVASMRESASCGELQTL